jgi:hypothetical protein
MDFVRFSGELAIYYVLIALGGGVVTGLTVMMFSAIDMNPAPFVAGWLIPCGATGAVIIGSWLVHSRQGVLYAASARVQVPPGLFDGLQLLLVLNAFIVDVVALAAMAARISEMGWTPNRVAALGENLILLANLTWSAWLDARFLRRRGSFADLERWQIAYLPVYAAWAALVVVVFPPVFGYR